MENKYIARGVRLEDSNYWHINDITDININKNKNKKINKCLAYIINFFK